MVDARPVEPWRVQSISERGREQRTIEIILEEPLSLTVNGNQVAVLMRLPGMEKELAAGFCVSEGLVSDFNDVLMIHHCGRGLPVPGEDDTDDGDSSRNRVDVRVRQGALSEEARMEVVRLIRSGCGAVDVELAELPLSPVQDGLQIEARVLLDFNKAMRGAQELYQHTGGVHAAALFNTSGDVIVLCEDVGRHNAVDKAIGHCLLRRISLEDKILFCSGRLSYEMATKAVRLRLPMVASVSAATALAVQIAERFNLSLIGYLRGGRMIAYAHPERILGP